MKQLRSVMAMIIFACLSQAFTLPSNNSTVNPGHEPKPCKGDYSAWVNPWVNVPGLKAKVFSATIDFGHDTAPRAKVSIFKLTINGTTVWDNGPTGQDIYTIANGSTVTLEVQVQNPSFFTITIDDPLVGQLFYQDTGLYATYTWTATAGHDYTIYARIFE